MLGGQQGIIRSHNFKIKESSRDVLGECLEAHLNFPFASNKRRWNGIGYLKEISGSVGAEPLGGNDLAFHQNFEIPDLPLPPQ